MKIELTALLHEIKKQKWIEAKTYKDTAPHEYILDKHNVKLCKTLRYLIKRYGFMRDFKIGNTEKRYRYFYIGEYSYWTIGGGGVNRCKLDGSFVRLF